MIIYINFMLFKYKINEVNILMSYIL
ncbi:conserved hypothetical protein [Xenorhabdus bovienii str. puntauvense]|uniref:Uncharacterized protein n=2 Tax=Xenorhabdus bovienii TaxID=40576 RepID=A0A0B6X321_XENBV|nr:conserved hypothetical protein [Xenorhabdus bovienii str. puntauvense]CDM87531.1 conserved protein of unknown function [Xenorhabdus bovienii]